MARMSPARTPEIGKPIALLLDVDGTLLEFAPHPDAVVVPPELVRLLAALHDRLEGALALVSGRSIDTLDSLFDPLRLPAVGLHGIERRPAFGGAVDRLPVESPSPRLLAAIEQAVRRYDSAFIEHKGSTLAVHHRLMKDGTDLLHRELKQACAAEGGYWTTLRGRQVIELKPALANKGHGCEALFAHAPFAGRHAVAFGDDTTDLDMFAAVARWGGTNISVGARIAGAGHLRLASPRQTLAVLLELEAAIAAGTSPRSALRQIVASLRAV